MDGDSEGEFLGVPAKEGDPLRKALGGEVGKSDGVSVGDALG